MPRDDTQSETATSDENDHRTTLLDIRGSRQDDLTILAVLSPPVPNPKDFVSLLIRLEHRPDVRWTKLHQVGAWLTALDATESGKSVAVSADGLLYMFSESDFSTRDLKCRLSAVWAASESEVFAVGPSGVRVRVSDNAVLAEPDQKGHRFHAVHGTSAGCAYAVGTSGAVHRYEEGKWRELPAPAVATLLTVLCVGDEVYTGGSAGELHRLKQDVWSRISAPKDLRFVSLAWYRGTLYAAAGYAGVYRVGANGVELVKKLEARRLHTAGDRLLVSGGCLVAQFDGESWWGGELDL